MTTTINPFTGQVYEIAADATEPLIIENFDITQDAIQLPGNPDSEVIPQFSFSDRYTLSEINGDTAISTLSGQLVAVVKGVTGLKTFTSYTEKGTYSLVSLENEFFSTYIEPNFYEPWYVEFDKSDYGNSVQKAIDAGLVSSAYEHYLKFGQFEGREDSIFAPKTDGNNTLYGSGYEGGLVGVPISEGVYTRDVKPVTTGVGEIDTLIGAPGEDTFFLGNARILNDAPQPFYVGGGDEDYALIKNLDRGSTYGVILQEIGYSDVPPEAREALTDRLMLAGKPYDYEFERIGDDLHISFQDDLVAIVEDAPPLDVTFYIAGGTYIYTTGNVATFDLYSGWSSENTLYEPFYFEENPGVEEAIANGEYASAFEHYVKVGQFNPDGEVIFSGSSGDDFLTGFGASSLLFGVEVTFVDGETEGYRTATMGVGEADFAVGGLGSDTFFIGNDNLLDPEKGGEVWYVGNGDEDYLTIQGFDPYKDFLFGAGNFEDYTFEVIDGVDDIFGRTVPYKSLEVNYKGDRVALIEKIDGSLTLPDITSLIAFPLSEVGEERPNGLALVASQNQFLPPEPPAGSEYWNEAFYLAVFPEVAELVANGEYESALDYYIQVGQFLTEKDGGEKEGYFTGTKGNDIIQGFGVDNDLHGTEIADVTFDPSTSNVSVTLGSTGVSEIDVLVGTDKTNGFYAGGTWTKYNTEDFTGESTPYYRGGGDKDYSLVKNYQPDKDYVYFAGSAADYQYQSVDGNFKVYTADGDLVTIIEGVSDLVVTDLNSLGGFYMTGYEFGNHGEGEEPKFRGFNEDIYLLDNPGVAKLIENGIFTSPLDYYVKVGQYADTDVNNEKGKPVKGIFSGTDGNDYVIGFGQNGYNLSGVPLSVDLGTGTNRPIVFETLGEGEIDTLIGTKGIANGFLLGSFPTSANNTPQPFYVGGGDDDYAVIKNFESGESLSMAGKPEDYNFEKTETGINVSYKGDLVAKVEGVESLQVSSVISPDVFVVSSYPGVENFNEDVFGSGDELLGGAGNDRFFVQTGGDNTLIGGMGADQFWIASSENPEFVNTIVDFTLGEDVLGIAGLGASFETLTLTQQEDNTLIAFNNNELAILNGIQASSLSTENFAFV